MASLVLVRGVCARVVGGTASPRPQCYCLRVIRRSFSPLAWYNKKLERSPLITKTITSGVLFSLGDMIAQLVMMDREGKFDWPRLGRAWVFGTFILGPLAHFHFNFLDWLVVKRLALPGNSMKMPVVKMVIEQFTYWAPGINCIYLFSLPMLEGRTPSEALQNVTERIWPILKANWVLWPAVQLINFKFVPLAHQLNFVLVVSVLWATFLSWSTGEAEKRRKREEEEKRGKPPENTTTEG